MKSKQIIRSEKHLTPSHIVEIETTLNVADRVVYWEDITTRVEPDDMHTDAPWEDCDGWEHTCEKLTSVAYDRSQDELEEMRCAERCCYSRGDRTHFWLTISDSDIVNKWGLPQWCAGASKQVRAEWIARIKKQAYKQLASWYENGWQYWGAIAEYEEDDITDSVWGIDDEEYAEECAETDCRYNVAHQLEEMGYIIENKPEMRSYSAADRMRDNIKRNLYAWRET